jgi:hypothetical protein
VGPDHLLWVIDLVHDQAHQQLYCTVAHYIDLNGKRSASRRFSVINPGSKGQDEQDGM